MESGSFFTWLLERTVSSIWWTFRSIATCIERFQKHGAVLFPHAGLWSGPVQQQALSELRVSQGLMCGLSRARPRLVLKFWRLSWGIIFFKASRHYLLLVLLYLVDDVFGRPVVS